jgi:hypothetical protein
MSSHVSPKLRGLSHYFCKRWKDKPVLYIGQGFSREIIDRRWEIEKRIEKRAEAGIT